MKKNFILFIFCILSLSLNAWELNSPNDKIIVSINKVEKKLFYNIKYEEKLVVKNSLLGIKTDFSDFSIFDNVSNYKTLQNQNVEYKMNIGKKSLRKNKFNSLELKCENKGNYIFIEFRAYNDGVTFRYNFNENKYFKVEKEFSSFNLNLAKKAWMQAYDQAMLGKPAYERAFSEVKVGTNAKKFPVSDGWCFPALFEFENNVFILLSEANLDKNYCGCKLNKNADNGYYKIEFPCKNENSGIGDVNPYIKDSNTSTPWRVLIIGSIQNIFESTLIDDCSSPFDKKRFGSTEWIKSGRSTWDWAANLRTGNFKKQKKMIDKAYEMGWEYCLVDANWNKWNKNNAFPLIKELCEYGKSKNVGVLLWYNSGGKHNKISEQPKDRMLDSIIRKQEMKAISELGVKGIKVDFFQSDKQLRINQYIDILEDALDYKLLVNFHGCTIPRGWQRTYPNLMTMEAVKGGEWYGFSYTGGPNAMQNLYYCYTRNVIGSMDFTPVVLEKYMQAAGPTYSHALAQAVIFESGIQHFAGSITKENRGYIPIFKKYPEVKLFLQNVNTAWDKSIFIDGHPSSHIVVARENKEKWFCAGMNGKRFIKNININFSFLPKGNFQAIIIKDSISKKEFSIEKIEVDKNSSLNIYMAPQGGFSILFIKK